MDNAINKYSLHLEVSTDKGVRGHVSSTLSEDAAAKMSNNSYIALLREGEKKGWGGGGVDRERSGREEEERQTDRRTDRQSDRQTEAM